MGRQLKRVGISIKQQRLISELKENGLGWIDFKNNNVYRERTSFNRTIRFMIKLDLVKRKSKFINGVLKNIIVLEIQGHLYYGDYLLKIKNMCL